MASLEIVQLPPTPLTQALLHLHGSFVKIISWYHKDPEDKTWILKLE